MDSVVVLKKILTIFLAISMVIIVSLTIKNTWLNAAGDDVVVESQEEIQPVTEVQEIVIETQEDGNVKMTESVGQEDESGLVEIMDEETPLAAISLDEPSFCMMHFIILFMAVVAAVICMIRIKKINTRCEEIEIQLIRERKKM